MLIGCLAKLGLAWHNRLAGWSGLGLLLWLALLYQLFDDGFLAGTGCVSNSHAFKDFECLLVHEAA